MKKAVISVMCLLIGSAMGLFAAEDAVRTFHGEVADSQCSMNVHSLTRSHEEMLKSKSMGGNAASCTLYCIRYMGGEFVLSNKKDVYYLDSASAQNFAGSKVKVTGTLDPKNRTIHAIKIEPEE
jgi:type 1 fimbria pilin